MEKWSNLPSHLLQLIIEKGGLTDELDLHRLQAVCSSWQSSINLLPRNSLHLHHHHHHLPLLFSPSTHCPLHHASFFLSYDTVYLLQPAQSMNTNPSSCWLVRVREESPGRVSLLCPVTQHQISYFPHTLPPQLDLLRFRAYQVTKIFHLHIMSSLGNLEEYLRFNYGERDVLDLWKVIVMVSNQLLVLAINRKYDLCFLKLGDSKWRIIHHKDDEIPYIDIAVRDEKFYAIDVKGTVSVFDKSLNQIKTIPPASSDLHYGWGQNLVASLDDMLLLSRRNIGSFTSVVDYDKRTKSYLTCYGTSLKIEIDVYRLVEEELRWEKVRDLGDRVLFVSYESCYSVSAKDFNGVFKGNCIYFGRQWSSNIFLSYDSRLRGLHHREIVVFNMEDANGGPLEAFPGFEDLFWPPPTWLKETTS